MTPETVFASRTRVPDRTPENITRAIADLVRRMVHARRGLSRREVVNWVSQFLGASDTLDIEAQIDSTIDLLCDLKDIGHGVMRGEPVLVAVPERRIALPDGVIIALGDHGVALEDAGTGLFPEVSGPATGSLIELLPAIEAGAAPLCNHPIEPVGRWTEATSMPAALRHAISLSGAFDPNECSWSISAENATLLNEWFALAPADGAARSIGQDDSQVRVAQASADARLVVEAGPGSGKTHTACERVISLVKTHEVAPSRILLLSFTRVAVAELRDRVTQRLETIPHAASAQIRTFDSFAFGLLAGSGTTDGAKGHDAGIRAATKLMRSDHPLVADMLSQLEHVIIDEAQDLVGDRKAMCEALVDLLDPACGITVFGDFAQSIYGYQRKGTSSATLLNEITARDDFSYMRLLHDHRTRSDELRTMFSDVRETLREYSAGARETYFSVRDQIRTAATENDITKYAVHPSTTSGLILTRSRRGLFTAAERMRAEGRHFRLRLSDRPVRIEPWIGAVLGGLPAETRLSQSEFRSLFEALRPASIFDVETCWDLLLDLDASGRDHIKIGHIAEALEDPPLELLSDHEGLSGPLLSTIHAIKGHEAERVMLLLTRAASSGDMDWAEEARTLYVGATRASTELRTGWVRPRDFYTIGDPQRYWTAHPDHRLIEIGLEGDLDDWAAFKRSGHLTHPADVISTLWECSHAPSIAVAHPDSIGRLILRREQEDTTAIGCLSEHFLTLIQSIRKAEPDAAPPDSVEEISIVGATTVIVPGRPGDAPSLALMPLLGGFARIAR